MSRFLICEGPDALGLEGACFHRKEISFLVLKVDEHNVPIGPHNLLRTREIMVGMHHTGKGKTKKGTNWNIEFTVIIKLPGETETHSHHFKGHYDSASRRGELECLEFYSN